jgi:2-polyprenyl-3-methyl-5-hydroxy-6-metoxy-1,4-benzoquinol methylase
MKRSGQAEILDVGGIAPHLVDRAYLDVARIHRWLGDTDFIVRAIRRDTLPVLRIMDVGCASGSVLAEVGRRLNVDTIGVDVVAQRSVSPVVLIVQADAVRDSLPHADVAFCMHMAHHLTEADLVAMIRNVGRHCRRFILMDLVRHPLPLALFSTFVAPFVSSITADDGRTSVRRSYTSKELRRIAGDAVEGSTATVRHTVAPFYTRQVIDVSWPCPYA